MSRKDGYGPLHFAYENGHFSSAQLLIDNGADINLIDKNGCNALVYAFQEGHSHIADLLLKNGVNINSCSKGMVSVLHSAL